jgi:GalNAc-alpha-(1->4)-GalNAc-alpha-(1->3)-diNAcBac-PP-undecaprenol alpha-1,4-N-acetyl-D-galactosaminyltransferase
MMIIPQNTCGGAERVMCLLANRFVERKIQVTFVNFDSDSSFYPISERVNWVKMNLEFKAEKKLFKIIEAPLKELSRYVFLHRLIKKERPDIILPFCEMAEILTIPNCLLMHIPFCVSVRNDYNAYFNFMKLLSRLTYGKANLVVCQTESVRMDLLKAVICATTVIDNPLDKSAYSEEELKYPRRKVIINVGRLMPQKNQKILIRAFANIADEFPDYELHIFGKGDLQGELEQLILELGLEKRILLKGVVPDVLRENRDVALFVLSSNYEGFPNTLVEAMANGIPVISTDFGTGAARDILNGGEFGGLVAVGDERELTDSMRDALSSYYNTELKAKKAFYIKDRLDADYICDQWITQIEATLK